MKVLQLLCGRAWGGGSVVVLAITRALIARGDDVSVFSFEEENDRQFREAGARLIRPPFWFHPINPLDVVILMHLWRLCRKEKFDLVATHTSKGGFLGRLAARFAGVPNIVHHAHGFSFNRPLGPLGKKFYIALERLAARRGDLIISVNEEQRRAAIDCGVGAPGAIRTIHNGIDIRRFTGSDCESVRRQLGLDDAVPLIGTVGRLAPQKGFVHLIRALPFVLAHVPAAHLVVVGEGPLMGELTKEAHQAGVASRAHFLGFRRDVADLMPAFDVFVQPSLWEGLSITLIEALAAGNPIVATNIESSREIIDDGKTGVLVPPGNPVALAEALVRLLVNRDAATYLAMNGRAAARERFSQERMVDQVLAAYDRVAHGHRMVESFGAVRRDPTSARDAASNFERTR